METRDIFRRELSGVGSAVAVDVEEFSELKKFGCCCFLQRQSFFLTIPVLDAPRLEVWDS
jgi:hypothetical protein